MDPSGTTTGKHGKHTAGSIKMPLAKSKCHTSSRTDSSPLLLPCGKASMVMDIKFRFRQLQEHSGLSPKSLFWTDILTHDGPCQCSTFDLPISRLLKKYSDEDSPPEPKLAIPISTITEIAEKYRWTTHLSAVADLVIIAFFYLLQV
jgi:hypothetical protein